MKDPKQLASDYQRLYPRFQVRVLEDGPRTTLFIECRMNTDAFAYVMVENGHALMGFPARDFLKPSVALHDYAKAITLAAQMAETLNHG